MKITSRTPLMNQKRQFLHKAKMFFSSRAWSILRGLMAGSLIVYLIWFHLLPWLYSQSWSGLGASQIPKDNREKTLWDWMDLFLVPSILAFGVWFLNRVDRISEQKIAGDRLQENALLNYLDRMTELILNNGLIALKKDENKAVRDLADARTITVLQGLDGMRKATVIEFLARSNLILSAYPLIYLQRADLRNVQLHDHNLERLDFTAADMENADLSHSDVDGARFVAANLKNANLTSIEVISDHYFVAIGVIEIPGLFSKESLEPFKKRDCSVDFSSADLSGANLENTVLYRAKLTRANLQGAILRNARLDGADLSGASITDEQLRECHSLRMVTMPSSGLSPIASRYDGRFHLAGDIAEAKSDGVDIHSTNEMQRWYAGKFKSK